MKLDEIDGNLALKESLLLDAHAGLLSLENVSNHYLMRKLKCTEDMAKLVIKEMIRRKRGMSKHFSATKDALSDVK
ncbi:MAG TPA: hypothetical protein VIJ14_08110 [Rhabdochlamydiaceae bacterium]